ncbi:MAG TPA: CdaR family protein [Bryobacteraceae bacterium]|nr:CdaR family protein [Bryobacteraceae bacterium]
MKRFFTENIAWKLLALAAAVLFWISVASEPELATFITVRVEYKNLSPDVEIDSDLVETAMLEVRGPSGELSSLPEDRRRYAVILDLSDAEPGTHTFTIDRSDVHLPRGAQLVRSIPSQIRINIEPIATRTVPVQVRFAGDLPPDLRVVEATAEPSALAIAGPASRVARITSVEIDPLRLKPAVGSADYRSEAFLQDPRVRFVDSTRVKVKVTVGKN